MPDLAGGRLISGQREITREMLFGRALRAAGGFAALGIEPGDTVALILRTISHSSRQAMRRRCSAPIASR